MAIEQVFQRREVSIDSSPISADVTASYGISEEVLLRALEYYESICSVQDINNIRLNLDMPLVDNCNSGNTDKLDSF
jgi:AraC-like DNA-binding protein